MPYRRLNLSRWNSSVLARTNHFKNCQYLKICPRIDLLSETNIFLPNTGVYDTSPQDSFLSLMMFCVIVPVLSVNMIYTCPSSSRILDDYTDGFMFKFSSNIIISSWMKKAYPILTNSRVNNKLIGMRLL
jgi:hypothetical protein